MENKKNISLNFWNKIDSFIKKTKFSFNNKKILLAISGGPDSLALLHYFLKKKNSKIIVAHFNHKIRGKDADNDENFVKKICKEYNIDCITESKNIPEIAKKEKNSIEAIARKERYNFLEKTAKKYKCSFICTAHHLDDNVETFFLNLLRGINLKGLKGIPVYRKTLNDIIIFRPLLSVTKKEIIEYLKVNSIKSKKDKTNEDEIYTRNWIRKKLLPLLLKKQPKIKEHILKIQEQIK